ncbi:MAG: DNA primase [Bacteroidetes bacterium]|nr:DNA primase [Bacteroidota bacterium]MCY4233385.1 DNA primase [Bacteroidota bacterium]
MRIPRQIMDQVRDSSDLLSIVQDYVKLKKAGNNYIGLCPFHDEKTPSFNVNPSKGFFKCFGCGKSGDVFTFVMEIERLLFLDAVRWLASRNGITIPEHAVDQQAYKEKEVVYHALRFAADYFVKQLLESGSLARDYLTQRGLTDKTIERFKLGWAPNSWDALIKSAEKANIKPETLVRAGLIKKREDSQGYYDRFRNRVIFPVWSHVGKIIGFGGRILTPDEKAPKYLNSPETEVYNKSYVLYGLNHAKREARQDERVLLVEGYTDVLALYQAGIGAVACCGTALTSHQVKLLGRYVKEVRLLYDADKAGVQATERAIDCVLQNGLDASVVSLPEGEDPDSFLSSRGVDEFKTFLLETTKDWMASSVFVAQHQHLLDSPQGMRQEISKIAKRISWIQDDLLRKLYIQKASQLFGVLEADIAHEVGIQRQGKQVQPKPIAEPLPQNRSIAQHIPIYEKTLLQIMLSEGAPMIEFIMSYCSLEEFQDGVSRELAEALLNKYKEDSDKSINVIEDVQFDISEDARELIADLQVQQYEVSSGWEQNKITVPEFNQLPKQIAKESMLAMKKKYVQKWCSDLLNKIINEAEGSETQSILQDEYREALQVQQELNSPDLFGKD